MRSATTIIIGAGQSGLAVSRYLTDCSIDHVLLERGQVANAWRTERWDSLRLLTPNWLSRLPGYHYTGKDPNGFRTLDETVGFLGDYARNIDAPVRTNTTVQSVRAMGSGYQVQTNCGEWACRTLVLANGALSTPRVPSIAGDVPVNIRSLTVGDYKRPSDVEEGGVLVVGASASGVQISLELCRAGRDVTLAVGEHIRVPRTYRGRDIFWLMDAAGLFDHCIDDVDDLERVRSLPSMQLIGSTSMNTIDVNSLQDLGVAIRGRLVGIRGNIAHFSGALPHICKLADLKMNRLLRTFDEWIEKEGSDAVTEAAYALEATRVPQLPDLTLNLSEQGIKTIIWATGFDPDYSWLKLPVLDHRGRLQHDGGVVAAPGVYAMGLPFMRKRKSSFIDGAADDARFLVKHLSSFLAKRSNMVA
ncbi:MAG: NAD(P)-binding domain-containing protein [Pseudomonadales bacterium]|nr:NAD(P)-binding domain-containing protein [Pseudomonadales bacterium]